MCYILTTSPKAFIKVKEDEIIVTSDYSKATQYKTIGEAIKAAAQVNESLGVNIVKAIHYGTSVSNSL